MGAGRDAHSPCSQKDDMDQIYSAFADCDVVVFASPVYFWTITGTLKTAADRLCMRSWNVWDTGDFRERARC